jgi:hypothetical protein
MSLPARYDIVHYQGDTYTLTLSLDGDKTASTPKLEISPPNDATPDLELTTGSGITATYDAPTDKTTYTIVITATQSTTLGATTNYWYDFQLQSGSVVTTFLAGSFTQMAQTSV